MTTLADLANKHAKPAEPVQPAGVSVCPGCFEAMRKAAYSQFVKYTCVRCKFERLVPRKDVL